VSSPVVDDFLIDDDNEEKFWSHGLSASHVRQVLERSRTIRRNRKGRRATHQMIGRDRQGRCIAIPIEPTHAPTIWRPVTAWPCKASEHEMLPKQDR
jgi:hypothetical protein